MRPRRQTIAAIAIAPGSVIATAQQIATVRQTVPARQTDENLTHVIRHFWRVQMVNFLSHEISRPVHDVLRMHPTAFRPAQQTLSAASSPRSPVAASARRAERLRFRRMRRDEVNEQLSCKSPI